MSTSTPRPNVPTGRSRRLRDGIFLAALAAMFVAGLSALSAATGWQEVLAQIAALSWVQVGVLLALSLVNYILRAGRWHLFSRALGVPTTPAQSLRHFLGGFAMTVTPGRVGELVRMRWLKRETGWAIERTAPLALVDRATDLAAMGMMLAVAVSFSTLGVKAAAPVAALAIAAAYVATHPRLVSALVTLLWRTLGLWPRMFARIRGAARSLDLFTGPGTLLPALALGFVGWIAEGYALYLLLGWMGADIGLWTAIGIFVFAMLAGGLTGAPGGLGGAEAAMIALLSMQGVALEVSVPATAIIRVTTLWFAIAIGFVVFPIAERASRRGCNA
ncbi:MAG: lysylphosphatidylglycerol synthase transmembrane domain-containing protein [Brevirhabdus sp.]